MNRNWAWCLIGVLLLASAGWSKDKNAGGGTEDAVAALEQKWLQSQKTNNPDMVAPLLADKFVNTGSDGKVTSKSESLANAKATKYDSVGKPLDAHERFTDTWVKMKDGKWQCVASHHSAIKM